MLTKYSDIVFDLGGVVFNIDRDRCVRNLEKLGLSDAGQMLDLYCQTGDFLALEQGKMSAGAFFDSLRAKANPGVTDTMITEALCSFITTLPVERLQALLQLREEGKRIFVLSNTNPIMFHTIIDSLFRQEGKSINDYFDGLILSFQEKVCKPSPQIFEILKSRYSLNGQTTLFLDDSAKNCHAAEECGINSVLVPEGADFMDLLKIL